MLFAASLQRVHVRTYSHVFALSGEHPAEEEPMSVRRRTWQNHDGSHGTAWIVDYVDQAGHRHTKNFERKRDADAYHATVAIAVRAGVHTADSRSITVAKAGRFWLEGAASAGLERATQEQ